MFIHNFAELDFSPSPWLKPVYFTIY